jgi:hypothetical protein
VTAVALLGDMVERSTQRYLVTKVLNLLEVSMGGSHNILGGAFMVDNLKWEVVSEVIQE